MSNADYVKNITRKNKLIPQTQSKVWDTYNAIAQSSTPTDRHTPRNKEETDVLHTEILYRIKRLNGA